MSRNQSYSGLFQGFPSQESEWVGLGDELFHLKEMAKEISGSGYLEMSGSMGIKAVERMREERKKR